MLSGAGVVKGRKADKKNGLDARKIYVHANYDMVVEEATIEGNAKTLVARLTDEDRNGASLVVSKEAPIYPVTLNSAGAQADYLSAVTEDQVYIESVGDAGAITTAKATIQPNGEIDGATGKTLVFVLAKEDDGDSRLDTAVHVGDTVRIDCYEMHDEGTYEMQIDASTFAGYYYIEASTLFRDEETGEDMPAEFVIPRGKIQSNFTFTMANSGDPSTFTFTIDCFPAFTKFNRNKKVMAALQVVGNTDTTHNYKNTQILGHENRKSDKDVDSWYTKTVFAKGE